MPRETEKYNDIGNGACVRMKQTEIDQMEALVSRLEGINAVHISLGEDGEPEEIHILADRSKSPKQFSRDIQSAVSAAMGCRLSHKIISIAQIDDDELHRPEVRLRIAALDISYSHSDFSARVTLEIGGNEYTGTAGAMSSVGGGRLAEVASACVSAVNDYLQMPVFRLYDVQKIRLGSVHTAVVAVSYCESGRGDRILTGTALTGEDEYYAAIKATLDALNRVLAHITAQQPSPKGAPEGADD